MPARGRIARGFGTADFARGSGGCAFSSLRGGRPGGFGGAKLWLDIFFLFLKIIGIIAVL
ncbi:MAG: hypothetical protein DBX55_08410 [Verrucomicrobia bacterium]|nr:MAG: hypothetical protein DBX55_08410 [Verrucomicrobiota bacterium]